MTILETYLVANVFLTGTMWEEIKLKEFTIRNAIGFIILLPILIMFSIPLLILGEIVDYCRYKFRGKFIDVHNVLYVFEKIIISIKRRSNK